MVHEFHQFGSHSHLLGIHLVFREVLDIDFTKITQAGMKGEEPVIDSFNFHSFQQLTAEMQTGGRSDNSSFITSKNILIPIGIHLFYRTGDIGGQRHFSQLVKSLLKLIVGTVVKES